MQTDQRKQSGAPNSLKQPRRKTIRDIEFLCLDCSLPICDEKASRCLYTIERTAPARRKEQLKKARQTFDARAIREAEEIKEGLVFILTALIAQRDRGEFK